MLASLAGSNWSPIAIQWLGTQFVNKTIGQHEEALCRPMLPFDELSIFGKDHTIQYYILTSQTVTSNFFIHMLLFPMAEINHGLLKDFAPGSPKT